MAAFLIWTLCCLIFLGLGIYCFRAEKPVAFWANAKPFPVKDVKGYNRACGKLWIGYGLICLAIGTPLLTAKSVTVILVSVFLMVPATIAMMLIYVLGIEKKYREK